MERALIAMSGGVDSSIAAWLMTQRGFQCAGVTMRQFRNRDIDWTGAASCCSWRDMEDAARIAFQLGIPHTVLDFTQEFRRDVIDKFVRVYESGGTPNPCLDCNRCMRAGHLMRYARHMNFNYVVTGHYARIVYDEQRGRWLLKRGLDPSKDQSYVHYAMTQDQLAHTLFPLGELRKSEVRALADKLNFVNARKRDSQDICFIPDGDYGAFLERYRGEPYPSGAFVDLQGNVVGTHEGAVKYTTGQRRGLHLSMGERVYVCGKDMEANTVTVGPESALYARALIADNVNWIAFDALNAPIQVTVQTRYRQKDRPAVVIPLENGTVRVEFEQPHRAITPGQAAVFYHGDMVLGGGTILSSC